MSPKEIKQDKLNAIYQGLLGLLQKRPLSDITVSELCRAADVSRTYYYRNFSSFQEIMSRYQEQAILDYLDRALHHRHIDFAQLMTAYFQMTAGRAKETKLLFDAGMVDVLISVFKRVYAFLLAHSYIDSERALRGRDPYFASFMAGAVVFTEKQWLDQGMQESPQEMGDRLQKLFRFS